MKYFVQKGGDAVVVRISGSMVSSCQEELRVVCHDLLNISNLPLILDLSEVDFMDSSGLSQCIELSRTKSSRGEMFACAGLNCSLKRLFHVSRADQRIRLYASQREALSDLSSN